MTKIISGKALADNILDKLKYQVESLFHTPCFAIILASPSDASRIYVNNKIKAAQKIGINPVLIECDMSISTNEVKAKIQELNIRDDVAGIIVQLPVYEHLDSLQIIDSIDPSKDVDGLHPLNVGMLYSGREPLFIPCTPLGIYRILCEEFQDLSGLSAVIIGRSNIVGRPLASLLLQKNVTVTLCHSYTKHIKDFTQKSDIIICASGKMLMFGSEYFSANSVIIDVGISKTSDGKVVGDVVLDEVYGKARAITKVPGGVGPMTIACLLSNVVSSTQRREHKYLEI